MKKENMFSLPECYRQINNKISTQTMEFTVHRSSLMQILICPIKSLRNILTKARHFYVRVFLVGRFHKSLSVEPPEC